MDIRLFSFPSPTQRKEYSSQASLAPTSSSLSSFVPVDLVLFLPTLLLENNNGLIPFSFSEVRIQACGLNLLRQGCNILMRSHTAVLSTLLLHTTLSFFPHTHRQDEEHRKPRHAAARRSWLRSLTARRRHSTTEPDPCHRVRARRWTSHSGT